MQKTVCACSVYACKLAAFKKQEEEKKTRPKHQTTNMKKNFLIS